MEESAANPTESPQKPQGATQVDHTATETPAASPAESVDEPSAATEPNTPTEEVSVASSPSQELQPLLAKASSGRLSPEDENQAADALRALLLGRREDLAEAVPVMLKLGWAASVKALGSAWPEMKATAKTNFLKALSSEENEFGRRLRLSIARGLFKVPDLPSCTKLILGVAKEIRDKESGIIPAKDAQSFANVMIGKGKPWVAQLPLSDLKPAEADLLVHCATLSAFTANLPPITLVGVLRWAGEAGRLESLHESASTVVAKSTARWSAKWTAALRKEVPLLPDLIAAGLKPETSDSGERSSDAAPAADMDDGLPAELKSASESTSPQAAGGEGPEAPQHGRQRPVYVSKTIPSRDQKQQVERPQQQPAQQSQPQPQPSSPRGGGGSARSREFNVVETLRQVDAHVAFLKGELKAAENKLRDRDDDRRQSRKKADVPVIPGELSPEELARLNLQLESRIAELQMRIDDLTADAEARAVSAGAFAATPETNPDTQLRTLLGLKLAEVYSDFCALETEDRDLVVPQHYRTLSAEVFEVLKGEGIPLEQPPRENNLT